MKLSNCLFALGLLTSSVATAQQSAPASPGTVDSVRAAAGSRNDSAGYNSAMGHLGQRGTKGKAVPATAADIAAGRPLRDVKGEPIAVVAEVRPEGVVVATGTAKVSLPPDAFGKDEMGLLLGITAAEFRSLVAGATTGNSGG